MEGEEINQTMSNRVTFKCRRPCYQTTTKSRSTMGTDRMVLEYLNTYVSTCECSIQSSTRLIIIAITHVFVVLEHGAWISAILMKGSLLVRKGVSPFLVCKEFRQMNARFVGLISATVNELAQGCIGNQ